jgi:O-succinylhomoserine sulfhydrylase
MPPMADPTDNSKNARRPPRDGQPGDESGWASDTLGVRGATLRTPWREHSPAIFATSSFVFDSAEQAAAVFDEKEAGYIYSRFTNPTVDAFEQRLALMEGGDACVATASGMSAILVLCMALLRQGDHVVASRTLFGSTISLFNNYMARFGIGFSYVDPCDLDAWRSAVTPATRMLFVETPTNPLCEIVDIAALADISRTAGARLVVDNCFLTPALQRPLALGADLVMHSATKYLDGQGRCVGGSIVGDAETVGGDLFRFMRTAGPSLSPFNAWSFLKGLETLGLRMRAHSAQAQAVAEWLVEQPSVAHVYYPGLADHPQHALAARQQSGFGGIVAFDLKGGQPAAFDTINRTRVMSITANLGDTRSTITHPASTTHLRIGAEARARAGIGDGLVRIAVGLEDIGDIIEDLRGALPRA